MNYYGYQPTGYGGMPHRGGPMTQNPGYVNPQMQIHPQYGFPPQNNFGGFAPNSYCMKCGGSGYRVKKNGKTKKCKCIKDQEKRMGKYYGNSSSDSY